MISESYCNVSSFCLLKCPLQLFLPTQTTQSWLKAEKLSKSKYFHQYFIFTLDFSMFYK